ncbi:MAG: hypothetical protein ACRDPK_01300 [Carbonactinosporaceae bacterium]
MVTKLAAERGYGLDIQGRAFPTGGCSRDRVYRSSSSSRLVGSAVATAQAIAEFWPIDVAERLRGRPSLSVHAARDLLMDPSGSIRLAIAAGSEPLILPDAGHYDVYEGDLLVQIVAAVVRTYAASLAAKQ